MEKLKQFLLNHETHINLIDFIKWRLIDLYRFKKYGKQPHLYGVRCVTGM